MDENLSERFSRLEANVKGLEKEHSETVGRLKLEEEHKTNLLKKLLTEFNIGSLEDLKTQIELLRSDIDEKLGEVEGILMSTQG